MTTSNPVPRRWFRAQFSLRMLLIFMAVVGVGLTVYRWPWEVSSANPHPLRRQTRTVTYRRGWTGKRLKHGSERIVDDATKLLTYEAFHFDDELRREWKFEPPGQLKTEIRYYPEREEKRVRYFADLAREGIVLEVTSWKSNQRLKREWRTYDGRLLQSQVSDYIDTFDQRQIEWNGQPLEKALPLLLADLPDEQARAAWLAPQSTGGLKQLAYLGDGTIQLQAKDCRYRPRSIIGPRDFTRDQVLVNFAHPETASHLDLHVSLNTMTTTSDEQRPGPSLAEQLLGFAAQHDSALCCRFGVVCVVPIAQAIREPADVTGVLAVNFAAGSEQAVEWLEPVDGLEIDLSPPSARLRQFFAATSIAIDLTQLQSREPAAAPRGNLRTGISLRPRRDLLGLFLWHHDCRVVQQGNMLIIRRRRE